MNKFEIRFCQVYRINGRLVVANSIEGAINTWREFMNPCIPDITCIQMMEGDSYSVNGNKAIVYAEGLCGDVTSQIVDDLAKANEEIAKLKYELEKAETVIKDMQQAPVDGTTFPTIDDEEQED